MENSRLCLIGSLHLDRALGPALKRLLLDIRPDVITVEISRFSIRFRQRAMPVWLTILKRNLRSLPPRRRGHSEIRLLTRQLRMPWEWVAACDYATEAGIRCIPVDSGNFARAELPGWHNRLLNTRNLHLLTEEPDFDLEQYFEKRRIYAYNCVKGRVTPPYHCEIIHPLSYLRADDWQRRELILARRVEKVASICCKTAHIGGWTHLLTNTQWKSMADLLGHLRPRRVMLAP